MYVCMYVPCNGTEKKMEGHPNCRISFKDLGEGLEKGSGRSSSEPETTRLRDGTLNYRPTKYQELRDGQTVIHTNFIIWNYTVQTCSY